MLNAGDDGTAAAALDTSNMSACSDEGLDVSQQFAETVFSGSTLDSDAEEIVSGLNCCCVCVLHLCVACKKKVKQSTCIAPCMVYKPP